MSTLLSCRSITRSVAAGALLALSAVFAGCGETPPAHPAMRLAQPQLAEALEASWRQLDASWTEGGDAPCDSAAIVAMATEGWVAGVDAAGLQSRFGTEAATARERIQSIRVRCPVAAAQGATPATSAAPAERRPREADPRPVLDDAMLDAYVRGMGEEIALMRASGSHFVSLSQYDAQGRQIATAAELSLAEYRGLRNAMQTLLYERMLHARYAGADGQARLARLEPHKREHALEVLARDPYAALSAAERDTVQARMPELQPLYTRYMELAAIAD